MPHTPAQRLPSGEVKVTCTNKPNRYDSMWRPVDQQRAASTCCPHPGGIGMLNRTKFIPCLYSVGSQRRNVGIFFGNGLRAEWNGGSVKKRNGEVTPSRGNSSSTLNSVMTLSSTTKIEKGCRDCVGAVGTRSDKAFFRPPQHRCPSLPVNVAPSCSLALGSGSLS